MPPLPADSIHARACKLKCEKILTRPAIIVSDMARQEDVTEALKAANQMEWVRRMNSIRNRAEEIVLTELVYE